MATIGAIAALWALISLFWNKRIHQSSIRLDSLFLLACRLPSRRRLIDARVGFDFLRSGAGGFAALSIISASWFKQSCRLRHWLRLVWFVIRIFVASKLWILLIKNSEPVIAEVSTISVAFEEVLLMCCPPAPLDRAKLHCKAILGTTRPLVVCRSSSGFTSASLAQVLSGWRESDPRIQLGKLMFYHWTTPAIR